MEIPPDSSDITTSPSIVGFVLDFWPTGSIIQDGPRDELADDKVDKEVCSCDTYFIVSRMVSF